MPSSLISSFAKSSLNSAVFTPTFTNLCVGLIWEKHYNRAMRIHKVLYEAFQRLSWHAFLDYTNLPAQQALLELHPSLQELRPSPSKINYAEMMSSKQFQCIQSAYMKFTDSDHRQTAAFWMPYCYMIKLLLQSVCSTRTGDWPLHLQCLHNMIP